MAERLIDEFIEKWLDLSLKVREKQGLDEALHAQLIELLGRIESELAGQGQIPKRLADVFLDLWGALTSCADTYDEAARRTIYVAADHLVFHAREICWS
ncbi:hypothetical protein SAMN04487939_102350 [Lysobacter sp. yr284]|uniref:hypothetical protein n=1 Tax=Lysobacter sp. yr284 TaxID=1761791 RepID=UPI00089DA54D|nr:hypothetical protein [Lysobacter sp. yr284]SDY48424.1 hypothetical protein SAMN04487939_102350 [Lysobacter sp. yr284]